MLRRLVVLAELAASVAAVGFVVLLFVNPIATSPDPSLSALVHGSGQGGQTAYRGAGDTPVRLNGPVTNKGVVSITGTRIEIRQADDLSFTPTFVRAVAGTTVTVVIDNTSRLKHTFTLKSQNVDEVLDPGKAATVRVRIPANGASATFYCRFHRALGMQGAFFSRSG